MKYKLGSNQFRKIPVYSGDEVITKVKVHTNRISARGEFKRIMKEGVKVAAVCAVLSGLFTGGLGMGQFTTTPVTVFADRVTEVPTMPDIPVMDRIAKCESSNSQTDKTGQVVIHVNSNGTYDSGRYQINSSWNATATKMGYNLANDNDNKAFAMWLYTNVGTSPWSSSSKCWNK